MPRHLANNPFVQGAYADVFTPTDPHGDVRTTCRTTIIDLKPWNGTSSYRDLGSIASGGSITTNSTTGEIALTTVALASSAATLTSRDYATYQTGSGLDVAIGIRLSTASFTGTQLARWGLFDGLSGTYYQIDSTGLSIVQLRASVATTTARASWNIDRLDGTGPSGYTLDLTRGTSFQITYSLCGHGTLLFSVIVNDTTDATQVVLPIHSIVPTSTNATTLPNPCMPLRVELTNGATSAIATTLSIGTRTAQIVAPLRPMIRWSNVMRDATVSITNTAFTFIMAIRKEDAGRSIRCTLRAIELLCTNRAAIYQILLNPTVTGGTFTAPTYQTDSHTVLQHNITATGYSGGTVIYGGTTPLSSYIRVTLSSEDDLTLATGDVWVLQMRSQAGGGNMQIQNLLFSEEW